MNNFYDNRISLVFFLFSFVGFILLLSFSYLIYLDSTSVSDVDSFPNGGIRIIEDSDSYSGFSEVSYSEGEEDKVGLRDNSHKSNSEDDESDYEDDNQEESDESGSDEEDVGKDESEERMECNDGVDNDGDGLIDWEYDLGCYNSEDGTERALSRSEENGWTTFDPSPDTKIIYVSSSEGSDSNDGLSPQRPLKSLSKAYNLVRDNYPDWVLLKRGDVWSGEDFGDSFGKWEKGGVSKNNKIVIATYGDSKDRPVLEGIDFYLKKGSHFALLDLEFNNEERSKEVGEGIKLLDDSEDILIEGNEITSYTVNVNLEGGRFSERVMDVEVRRNVILDSYSSGDSHSQGLFAFGIDGLLLEENVFDHNGWNDEASAIPTQFNHNAYIQNGNTEVVVRGNIFSRASSHGIQQRPGGLVEDNLFVGNSIGLSTGGNKGEEPEGDPSLTNVIVRDNVVLQGSGKTVYKSTEGDFHFNDSWGIDVVADNLASAVIEKNIVANTLGGRGSEAFDVLKGECINDSNYQCTGNIIHNWGDAQNTQGDYPDPSRTVEDYMSSIGESASLNAFYARIREQSKFNWDERFTSTSVNDYIRAGFN